MKYDGTHSQDTGLGGLPPAVVPEPNVQ
jgi:hypothetical protein